VLGLRLALKFRASVRGRLGFRVRLRLGSGSEADVRNGDFQEEGDARGESYIPRPPSAARRVLFLWKLMFGFRLFDGDRNAIRRSRSVDLRFACDAGTF